MSASPYPLKTAIVYPDSDGAPVAESDLARDYLLYSVEVLRLHFEPQSDIYVSGNLFIYYQQGVPSAVIAPDVFVIFGVANHKRMSYKAWQENNRLPDFILEITSAITQAQDEVDKVIKYARLGVREYFQYDPSGDYLKPRLKGRKLVAGEYQPLELKNLAAGVQGITSEVLGLELRLVQDGQLRFYDPKTQEFLLTYGESAQARREAELQCQQAELQRQQAEQSLRKAIPRLRSLGLTSEQIASSLNLPLAEVENYEDSPEN